MLLLPFVALAALVDNVLGVIERTNPQRIQGDDLSGTKHFGSSIAASGDYLLVGAEYENLPGGTAYLFARNSQGGWNKNYIRKFVGGGNLGAGTSIGIYGNTIALGAWATGYNDDPGRVHLYIKEETGQWPQTPQRR